MIKQIVFSLVIFSLYASGAMCQNADVGDVKLKLENYFKNFPSEKLYVHTDKSFYTTGEIIWFKIYRCNDSLKSDVLSKLAYVDLLDEQNNTILKTKIEMEEKDGNGSLELPLTLNSGHYTLRAYTNWMKNFGAEHFFEKKIALVNPFKNISSNNDTAFLNSMELFPEGGNLVNGILSQVAFKINSNKSLASGRGYLLDENNDTISRFAPYKFSLGSFYFTPQGTHQYKAIFIFSDNSLVAKPLPQIFSEGYVMHIDEENQKINVTIHTSNSSVSELFLVAQNHQKIKVAKKNSIANGLSIFSINKSDLGPGVSQLTVFNQARQPVCERLFFIMPPAKTVLTTTPSKPVYNNREKVSLTLSSAFVSANLSVAVFQFDSLQKNDEHDIASYFWLESELNGKVENPQFYLSGNSEEVRKAADYLMLTYGWRRFDWNKALNGSFSIKFPPESLGQVITCKITDRTTGNPVKNVNVFLSIPETNYKLFSAISDSSGIVRFRTNEFFGKGEVILQTAKPEDNFKIEILNPFFEQTTIRAYDPFTITLDRKPILENYSINMQSQHIYSADSIQKFIAPALKDTFPFYGQPQNFYLLDNYTRFTTMEEVLREYVREINVGVKGTGNLKFKLLSETNQGFFTDNILVMIDGIPVSNPDKIFSVDPLKIRRIDIIPRNYILGSSFFYGLANFTTYKENHEGIDIDPKAIVLDYEGLQIKREFYSPDYSNTERFQSRIPDLRNTLYWSPSVTTNQQIQFYTSDNKGKYLVVVQGFTNDGKPLTSVSEFEVK